MQECEIRKTKDGERYIWFEIPDGKVWYLYYNKKGSIQADRAIYREQLRKESVECTPFEVYTICNALKELPFFANS